MKSQYPTNDEPQTPTYNDFINSWAICPPSELSNLFYFRKKITKTKTKTKTETTLKLEKYTGSYQLTHEGIKRLLQLELKGQKIKAIRIYMGCGESTIESFMNESTFYPIFAIVTEDGEDRYPFEYTTDSPIFTAVPISGEIAGLFQTHWNQLSDEEIAAAFSGLTVSKHKPEEPISVDSVRTLRVKFYEFPKADVYEIIKQLKNAPELQQELALMLGAGLTVRITHPFNFRPILAVPIMKDDSSSSELAMDSSGIAYFERSQPCPPYCPNGDTSELTH